MIQKTGNEIAFQDAVAELVKCFDRMEKQAFGSLTVTVHRKSGVFYLIESTVSTTQRIENKLTKELTKSQDVVTMP